jgi:hypothetical protein
MQKSIAKNYRVGRSTICNIIHETTEQVYGALLPKYLAVPSALGWLQISKEFEELWQFPHCIGAIDGKHFRIPQPPNSGTTYYNYKVNSITSEGLLISGCIHWPLLIINSRGISRSC